jgi:hypothetical protein
MQNSYLDNHPSEEALERFLLHQSPDPELETVETHILACDACVSRLEALETHIAAMKMALGELHRETAFAAARQHGAWKEWFTVPHLSWAGAAAAVVAAGLIVTPQLRHSESPADVTLSTYRDLETGVVPENRPLHVHFNAQGLPDGPVTVQLVNETGAELWKGAGVIHQEKAEVTSPKIAENGSYLFRLYAGTNQQGELLREYSFQVK